MQSIVRKLLPLAACAALSCGQQAKKTTQTQPPPTPAGNHVVVSTTSKSHSPAGLDEYFGQICATIDLIPYKFQSGLPVQAGPTVTIHSTPYPTDTDAVLACTAGQDTDANGNNWGYTVSARDFGDCTSYTQPDGTIVDNSYDPTVPGTPDPTSPPNGQPIPGAASVVPPVLYSIVCSPDIDNALELAITLPIAESNGTGYVDVATTVGTQEVMVGCKTADFGTTGDGILHFGSTSLYPQGNYMSSGNPPLALTGVGFTDGSGAMMSLPSTSPAAPALAQFSGLLTSQSAPIQSTAYINGTLAQGTTPTGSAGTWDVVQTFLPRPSDDGQWCAGTLVPECDTTITSGALPGTGTDPSTATQLASAVITLPTGLWMIANVSSDGAGLQIISGNSVQYSDPAAATTSNHWNGETTNTQQTSTNLYFPANLPVGGNAQIIGTFIDTTNPGSMIVEVDNGDKTTSYYSVSYSSTSASWQSAPIAALTTGQSQAVLTPFTTGCLTLPVAPLCAPQGENTRGWADQTGAPSVIALSSNGATPGDGTTWTCTVERAAGNDTNNSTFTCDCTNVPAGWSCAGQGDDLNGGTPPATYKNCVLQGPCDGADGTTASLVLPEIIDTSLAGRALGGAQPFDGAYSYSVVQSGSDVLSSGTVYMHSELNKACGCAPEASQQEVAEFLSSVPDCGSGSTAPAGPCISHDASLTFGPNTNLANPSIELDFPDTRSDTSKPFLTTVLNWVIGTPIFHHGYGNASYPPNGTVIGPGDRKCALDVTLLSLRHNFAGLTLPTSSGINYIIATRQYGQFRSQPTNSCANVWRTGIKNNEIASNGLDDQPVGSVTSLLWTPGVQAPPGVASSRIHVNHAPHVVAPSLLDANGVLRDIDCASGAVFDAQGNGVCLKKRFGKIEIERYWHNIMCPLGSTTGNGEFSPLRTNSFSSKTTTPNGFPYMPE